MVVERTDRYTCLAFREFLEVKVFYLQEAASLTNHQEAAYLTKWTDLQDPHDRHNFRDLQDLPDLDQEEEAGGHLERDQAVDIDCV